MSCVPVIQNISLNTIILLCIILFLGVKQYHHVLVVAANLGKPVMDIVKESSQFRVYIYESLFQKPFLHLCSTCGDHRHGQHSSVLGHHWSPIWCFQQRPQRWMPCQQCVNQCTLDLWISSSQWPIFSHVLGISQCLKSRRYCDVSTVGVAQRSNSVIIFWLFISPIVVLEIASHGPFLNW